MCIRTQFQERRARFCEVYTEGRRENKLMGLFEKRIPRIPRKE